jgi:hypothetical protein
MRSPPTGTEIQPAQAGFAALAAVLTAELSVGVASAKADAARWQRLRLPRLRLWRWR